MKSASIAGMIGCCIIAILVIIEFIEQVQYLAPDGFLIYLGALLEPMIIFVFILTFYKRLKR